MYHTYIQAGLRDGFKATASLPRHLADLHHPDAVRSYDLFNHSRDIQRHAEGHAPLPICCPGRHLGVGVSIDLGMESLDALGALKYHPVVVL